MDAKLLPTDPEALKTLLLEQSKKIFEQDSRLKENHKHIRFLEEQIALLRNQRFGKSSEKSSPDQIGLFNEAESEATDSLCEEEGEGEATEAVIESASYTRRKSSGRKPLPADLPRVRIEHDLPKKEKICDCGCALKAIGEEVSEQLDIIPAKIQVLQHVRKKYACGNCEVGVKTAALPAQPIPKSNASPNLLAYITTAKYQDAMPLARLEKGFQRIQVELPRSTLANWMIRCSHLVQPLLNLFNDKLREGPVIQCDETPLQVLNEPEKSAQSKSYMWIRRGGLPDQKVILFDYSPSRSGAIASDLLSGYRGYLQTDDYSGYYAVATEEQITHLGCWAHARRKFVEAQVTTKAKSKNKKSGKSKPSRADIAINYITHLYNIERKGKELSAEERYQLRQKESLPVLDKLHAWLEKTRPKVIPKSTLGKALNYLHKNWRKLQIYTASGNLKIDNNAAENAIRPFVVGRKNWLFSATPRGAHASAALYSLIETAKGNDLEPYAYLCKVFSELPKAQSLEDIEVLLPWNIKQAD
ncbi:IS66 family transposase [Microbulbifer sp. SSSA002]|uniref:IS66 family transposase n=1 Tax=Microbulbifer sp. SSSA002 TaxID=3243376 RepID=UPI00403A260D